VSAEQVIRKNNFRWWSKFNYITSAAADSWTIISTVLNFLLLQMNGQSQLDWWGTGGSWSVRFFLIRVKPQVLTRSDYFCYVVLDQIAMDRFHCGKRRPRGLPKDRLGH